MSQVAAAQLQTDAADPVSRHLWRERQSRCHMNVWPLLKFETVSPLPIAVATRKRMIEIHAIVRSSALSDYRED